MEIKGEFDDRKVPGYTVTVYCCTVTECSITARGTAVAAFKGQHKTGKNNNSVKALLFEKTKVLYLPRNLMQIFPNLIGISVVSCGLKKVSAEDMIGLEKLQGFFLPDNDIETLPVDLLKNMANLKIASFDWNRIGNFDAKILEPIKNTIEVFSLRNNPGVNEVFGMKETIEHFIERLEFKKIDSKRFNDLFTSGKYSDLTIKVQGKEYKVHKGILASMSSVFDKMFTDDPTATAKTFNNLKNFSQDAIEEFLRFFYLRTGPSGDNAIELLKLAVKFDVPDLTLQCESTLVEMFDPESARQLFNLAVQYSLPKLKRKAFEAIKELQPEIADYIYDQPKLVNQLIDAKDAHQTKKIKLDNE